MNAGKPIGEPFGDPAEYSAISVAPDGSRIAATINDPTSGRSDLWLIDSGGARTRWTFGGSVGTPVYSPDGSRVAYSKYNPRGMTIFIKPTSGGAQEQAIQEFDAQVNLTDWSRDGRFLALDYSKPGSKTKQDIWVLPLFGDRKPFPFLATEANEQGASFSPDGRWIAYMSDESGRPEVYAGSFPNVGQKWQISSNGTLGANWISENRIAYGSLDGRSGVLVSVRSTPEGFEIGGSKTIALTGVATSPAFTSDGQRAIFESRATPRRPHASRS